MFTHEEVVSIRIGPSNAKQLHQIMKLPMDITAYGYWAFLLMIVQHSGHSTESRRVSHTTGWTLDSSCKTSLAYSKGQISRPFYIEDQFSILTPCLRTLSHSLCTSVSASCLQFIKLSIQPSRVGIDAGSDAGDNRWGSGSFPTSTSIFESIIDDLINESCQRKAFLRDAQGRCSQRGGGVEAHPDQVKDSGLKVNADLDRGWR